MTYKTIAFGLLALLVRFFIAPLASAQPASESEHFCLDSVIQNAQQAPASDDAAELEFQRQMLSCVSPESSSELIQCAATIQRDYTALAMGLRRDKLTPALYLQRIRDRTRKLTRCLQDSAWSQELALGDADSDRVADARDRCPNTQPLLATDDDGCHLADASQSDGPNPELVRRFFQAPVIMPSRACQGSKSPTGPQIVSADSLDWPAGGKPRLQSVLGSIPNASSPCPVAYELEIEEVVPLRLIDSNNLPRTPERVRLVVTARSALASSDPSVLVFELEHPRMTFLFHQGATLRARAIDGATQRSAWTDRIRVGRR